MRNFQACFMNAQISYHQDIQIKRARTVQQARGAITAVISFEIEQAVKEGARCHPGFESNDSVHETRLLGESNGLGGIERRACNDAADGFEAGSGCGQRSLGRPSGAGEIRAHSDVSRPHACQLLSAGAGDFKFMVTDQSCANVAAVAASAANQTANATRTAQAGATPTRFSRKGRKFHVVMWT